MLPKLSTYRTVASAATSPTSGGGRSSVDEPLGIERRAELRERHPEREMRRRGREQIAAVERPRDGLERVLGVRELVSGDDPCPARGRQEQPVVRADVLPALPVLERERPPRAADPGIDDREMDADGHVADRVREHERTLEHRLRRDAVRDVDDLRLRGDALHHPVTRSDEVVLKTEVGQERDEHGGEPRRLLATGQRRRFAPEGVHCAARSAPAFAAEARTARPDAHERRRSLQRQRPANERLPRQAERIPFGACATRAA